VTCAGTDGQVVLGQIRTVDRSRLARRLGTLDEPSAQQVLAVLAAMLAP
jgi:mRNA interferase MazF